LGFVGVLVVGGVGLGGWVGGGNKKKQQDRGEQGKTDLPKATDPRVGCREGGDGGRIMKFTKKTETDKGSKKNRQGPKSGNPKKKVRGRVGGKKKKGRGGGTPKKTKEKRQEKWVPKGVPLEK